MLTKSRISLIISVTVLLYITFNLTNWRDRLLLCWDSSYYYLYLPATIIYHDLGKCAFYPEKVRQYDINRSTPLYDLYPQKKTGRLTNKYAVGVSVCELPLFLVAHLSCTLFHAGEPDGFSEPYRMSALFSVLIWVVLGLMALRKVLLRLFSEGATAFTLLLVMFGTNLYFYTVFSLGMSHPYSFAFFCFTLYFTERVYRKGMAVDIILLGLCLGMIAIIRPTNAVIAIIPIFWPYPNGNRLRFILQHKWPISISLLLCGAVCFIQLAYLKYTSGNWFHFSYEREGFDFLKPEIMKGLFSYRKGWFLYTPLAVVMCLGIIPLYKQHKQIAKLVLVFLVLHVYIIFSWCHWEYGGGFGCRPMVEAMALLALPLAAIIQTIIQAKSRFIRIAPFVIFAFFITLNTFQSYQLYNNITVWDETTGAFYWRSFGKLKLTDEDRALLQQKD